MTRLVVFGLILALVSGALAAAWALSTRVSGEAQVFVPPVPVPAPAEPGPIPSPDQFNENSVPFERQPWPAGLSEEIISLALSDPQTQQMLEGHRYRVSDFGEFYGKSEPCDSSGSFPPPLYCAQVWIYDYTVPTGVMIIVDFHNKEVVQRKTVPEYQPPLLEGEFAEITKVISEDPRFGSSTVVPAQVARLIGDDSGGNCGAPPRHRCFIVFIRRAGSEPSPSWVAVDMVDQKITRIGTIRP